MDYKYDVLIHCMLNKNRFKKVDDVNYNLYSGLRKLYDFIHLLTKLSKNKNNIQRKLL